MNDLPCSFYIDFQRALIIKFHRLDRYELLAMSLINVSYQIDQVVTEFAFHELAFDSLMRTSLLMR